MVAWIEELSLSPRFNHAFAMRLAKERNRNIYQESWERLLQLTLVSEVHDGYFELHKIFQDSLRSRLAHQQDRISECRLLSQTIWSDLAAASPSWVSEGCRWYHARFVNYNQTMWEASVLREDAVDKADAMLISKLRSWWSDIDLRKPPQTYTEACDWLSYGSIMYYSTIEDRASSIDNAIQSFQNALSFFDEQTYSALRVRSLRGLGMAYQDRATTNRAVNDLKAIECFEQALSLVDRNSDLKRGHNYATILVLRLRISPQEIVVLIFKRRCFTSTRLCNSEPSSRTLWRGPEVTPTLAECTASSRRAAVRRTSCSPCDATNEHCEC